LSTRTGPAPARPGGRPSGEGTGCGDHRGPTAAQPVINGIRDAASSLAASLLVLSNMISPVRPGPRSVPRLASRSRPAAGPGPPGWPGGPRP
jgi:hypothetical protein